MANAENDPADKDQSAPGGEIWLRDPRLMRALAHPTRMRLLGELRARGTQTVGMLSEVIDEAPGSVSYHLGILHKHGLVVEASGHSDDKRERWWQAAHARTRWEASELIGTEEQRQALRVLRGSVFARYLEELETYLDVEASLPTEWVAAATSGDSLLQLTSEQLAELSADLHGLAAKWSALSDGTVAGAESVSLIYHAFRR